MYARDSDVSMQQVRGSSSILQFSSYTFICLRSNVGPILKINNMLNNDIALVLHWNWK